MNCVFCDKEKSEILFENEYAKSFYDSFPVNKGHILVVPKEHKIDYFDLSEKELVYINRLILQCTNYLNKKYQPDGYNIGFNVRESGGQTIFHCHCHIIPRYKGDVEKPKGGVRNIKTPLVEY